VYIDGKRFNFSSSAYVPKGIVAYIAQILLAHQSLDTSTCWKNSNTGDKKAFETIG